MRVTMSDGQSTVCAGVAYHRRDGCDVDALVEDVECAVAAIETFIPQTDNRFFCKPRLFLKCQNR